MIRWFVEKKIFLLLEEHNEVIWDIILSRNECRIIDHCAVKIPIGNENLMNFLHISRQAANLKNVWQNQCQETWWLLTKEAHEIKT